MKNFAFAVFSALVLSAAAEPRIKSFAFDQDRQAAVTISFKLDEKAVLTMDVKTNGVSIGWRNFRDGVTGADLNRVNPAGDYTLSWNPHETWPGDDIMKSNLVVEVKTWSPNDTPDFMDVDLTAYASGKTNIAYYVDEADLPEAVTSDTYKTTHLLMKRMHSAHKVWMMGAPTSEANSTDAAGGRDYEHRHQVSLSADFYIAVFELTQKQWTLLGNALPSDQSVTGDRYPVANRIYQYLRGWTAETLWPLARVVGGNLLTMRNQTGVQFDFPTEAQWEFACRGGKDTAYPDGSESITSTTTDTLSKFAVWSGNAPKGESGNVHCEEVGTKEPNGYGLYDMCGNVSEYCVNQVDWVYPTEYVEDPVGRETPDQNTGTARLVLRGGNYTQDWCRWDDYYHANIGYFRCAYRGSPYVGAQTKSPAYGMRLVAPVGSYWPAITPPVGTLSQDPATRIVTVTYDLAEDSIVTAQLLLDGEPVSDTAIRAISGDVNRFVKSNENCRISWSPDESWPGQLITSGRVSFKLKMWPTNDPPAYMALNLNLKDKKANLVNWYPSAEAMPEPITNDVWKKDFLVMRRIPAKDVVWWMGIATNAAGESVEHNGYDVKRSPRHLVKLSQDYYMSVFELTERQFNIVRSDSNTGSILPKTGSQNTMRMRGDTTYWPNCGHKVPVDGGMDKFRKRFNLQFDFPTEAQWEFAARAGSSYAFSPHVSTLYNANTDANLDPLGWYVNNSDKEVHVGGGKAPNPWGLYDMYGNVSEYCLDIYTDGYGLTTEQLSSGTPVVDPFGPYKDAKSTSNKILRGGHSSLGAWECRNGDRSVANHPDTSNDKYGYRLVCPLPGATFPDPVIPQE